MFRLTTDAAAYEKALAKLSKDALPKVTARTLNAVSTAAAAQQKKNIHAKMIVRAKYTDNSLKHYKASEAKPIARQNAVVGSTSSYLPIHDSGGTIRAKKQRIAIPTNKLRGVNRRKKISPSMRIGEQAKRKFFVLGPASPVRVVKRPGLYYRKSKTKIVRVRDLSMKSFRLRGNRWHSDAVAKYAKAGIISAVFIREAKKELAKVGK